MTIGTIYTFAGMGGGVGNTPNPLISGGMVNLARKLDAPLEVSLSGRGEGDWQRVAQAIIKQHKAGQLDRPLCLIGHSRGGEAIIRLAREMAGHGIRVDYLAVIELTMGDVPPVPGNVALTHHFEAAISVVNLGNSLKFDDDYEKNGGQFRRWQLVTTHVALASHDTVHRVISETINSLHIPNTPADPVPAGGQAGRQWTHHVFDRAIFFDAVRRHPFDGRLTQGQVDGMNALLDVWETRFIDWDMRELAYNLATAWWETGRTMQPVEENGDRDYFLRYDIAGNARKARELGNTEPGDGWRFRGMGHVQSTGRANARRQSIELRRFGIHIDLEAEPDRRRQEDVSILSLFVGNHEGWWTGRRLPNFAGYGNWDMRGARTVVNGTDRWAEIGEAAGYFLDALNAAAMPQRAADSDPAPPAPVDPSPPVPGAPGANEGVLTPEAIADLSADELMDLIRRADALRGAAMDALEARIEELKSNQARRPAVPIEAKGNDMKDTKTWLTSKGVIGSLVALAASILFAVTGIDLDQSMQDQIVQIIIALMGTGGASLGLIGRLLATKRIG